MEPIISNIDIGIIIAYFVLIFALGFYVARGTKTDEDLFLGGRSLGWGFIGLSLFASNISSSSLIGLAGAAYSTGIVQSVYEWGAIVPLVVMAFIYVPLYLKAKITTVPEFLEYRFDRRSRYFFSGVTIVASILIDTAGGLYAGAIVLQTFFPWLELWYTCGILAVIAGLYTAFGGLKAVVYTDALQAVILIAGCSVLAYLMFEKIDFSWANMVAAAPEGHFSIIKPLDDEGMPWLGIIMGVPFMAFWYVATNQYITQRVLGAKSIKEARWGIMFASALKLLPLFIMILPGAIAISVYPGLETTDMVFPTMILKTLPVGLVGLVLAGLISAIMSSVDSTLNSASTLIVVDFVKTRKPDITSDEIVRYSRMSTFALMIFAAVWAPQIANFGGLWAYLQQMYSIMVPPIVVLFTVGVFYKRGNGDGAFWTLVLGSLIGVVLFVLGLKEMWPIHFTINVGLVILISSAIFIVISNSTKAPDPEAVAPYVYDSSLIGEDNENVSWYSDYRIQGGILLALVALTAVFLW